MEERFDYEQGFVVDPETPWGEKQPYVDYGTKPVDTRRYWDQETHEREWDKLWTKVWLLAGIASDAPNPGDYFKFDIGRASIVVVRGEDGELRAFHNVCQHRANPMVDSDFGSLGGCFHCSFHGWEYGLDGKLTKIRDEEIFRPELVAHRPGLTPVQLGIWENLVFITMNENPPPLLEFLHPLPEHLAAFRMHQFRPYRDDALAWDANWKTAEDAFLEFYHGDDVHPEAIPMTESLKIQYDVLPNGHSRMIIPVGLPRGFKEGDTVAPEVQQSLAIWEGSPDEYPDLDLTGGDFKTALVRTKRKWAAKNGIDFTHLTDSQVVDDYNYSIFPNVTLNIFSDVFLIQRWLPHATDPEKSYYSAITLANPVADPDYKIWDINSFGPEAKGPMNFDGTVRPPRNRPTDMAEFGYVLHQDIMLVPQLQKGIRSPGFKGLLLGEAEVRIRHYLAEVDRYLDA